MKYLITILLFLLSMTGCHSLIPHHPLSACAMHCQQQFKQCTITCHNNCPGCTGFAIYQASRSFKHYVHEQRIKGDRVIRTLNSFRDPLQCRKTTCHCSHDFQVCSAACTGFIFKELKVPTVC